MPTSRFKIMVTQADIDAAIARQNRWYDAREHRCYQPGVHSADCPPSYNQEKDCPIGQALQRMGYARDGIRVSADYLTVNNGAQSGALALPWPVERYVVTSAMRHVMREWDARGRVVPTTLVTTEV